MNLWHRFITWLNIQEMHDRIQDNSASTVWLQRRCEDIQDRYTARDEDHEFAKNLVTGGIIAVCLVSALAALVLTLTDGGLA